MWKVVENYPNIEVSKNGEIRNVGYSIKTISKGTICIKTYKGKVLKPLINKKNGYPYVYIKDLSGKYKRVLVHRIVAQAFIPNLKNKAEVNHKNGIKTDNRVANLEWATRCENIRHAFKMGLIDKQKMSISHQKNKIN